MRTAAVYLALVFGMVAFTRVGALFSLYPADMAARSGITLQTPGAVASFRVLAGAFHVGAGLIALSGLVHRRFAGPALASLALVTAAVVVTRWAGYLLGEGVALAPAVTECVALAAFALGWWCSRPLSLVQES